MARARSDGQRKYLAANSAQADFTTITPALANGRRADISAVSGVEFIAYNASTNPYWKIVQLGAYRGARLRFFGAGADNATGTYRLWSVWGGYNTSAQTPNPLVANLSDIDLCSVGAGALTLSTAVGPTGDTGLVLSSERLADTVTYTTSTTATTPPGPQTVFESAYGLGTSGVYSPVANVPGCLVIPDFGSGCLGFVLEFALGTATGLNALVELTA